MRTSYFAGISLLLLLGCGTEATPGPGTTGTQDTTPSATGGSASKTSSSTKSTKGGSAAKTSEGEGGADSEGGAPSEGGADSTTKTSSSKSTGGTKSSSASSSKATGGKSSSSGSVKTSSTGGAGGKSSGSGSSAGGKSSTAAGGTSTVATTGSGNTGGAATFKCDNLQAAAGQAGQAKPSGAAGGLKVLDWAGFKGAVSFTFDDNNSSQVSHYAELNKTGAKVTFFLVSSWGGNAIWKTAVTDGHELGNHTNSHSNNAASSDLKTCQDFLKTNYGVTGYTMAAPNGTVAWGTPAKEFFIANRGVSNAAIKPRDNTDIWNLPAYLPGTNESAATMSGQVTAGAWRVFCVHGFEDAPSGTWQPVKLADMTSAMSKAVSDGFWAETMMNVTAYYLGQKAIPASSTTSAKWTLPAHFPPNMCVRATTTGGTVKQKGAEVPWNDHGYYEISLDAGEVTVE